MVGLFGFLADTHVRARLRQLVQRQSRPSLERRTRTTRPLKCVVFDLGAGRRKDVLTIEQ
jgi:hypothetical protein